METSKTPQFDALLDDILNDLKPHTRKCIQHDISKYCEGDFNITDDDIHFYTVLRVPPPKCCPTCRRQHRFAFINRYKLYKRKDDAPNQKGPIISYIPPDSPLTVYNFEFYRSDAWDPFSYARMFDNTMGFLDQLYNLRLVVPQPSMIKDPSNINYEYSLNGRNSKNVYCSSGAFNSEDIWYSVFLTNSRLIMDGNKVPKDENCYEILFSEKCNNCDFIYFSRECIDSSFIYDCRNCQDCFGCVNLRNKRYCFFNEQLSKEEYDSKIASLKLDTRSSQKHIKEMFWNFVKSQPVLASRNSQIVDSTGVLLFNTKNCKNCLSAEKSENERYSDHVIGHKDSMDIYSSGGSELMYQSTGAGSACASAKFLVTSKFITHSEYLINCRNCEFCFGCIGLENKKHCIFNRQYEPEEYFVELDKIKTAALEKGEYGEPFSYKFSSFSYNDSEASDPYPLNKNEVNDLGALWQDEIENDYSSMDLLSSDNVPDSIFDIGDDILSKALICEETGKPFRIIASELEFLRRKKLPIPYLNPYLRMKNLFHRIGSNLKYETNCSFCNTNIESIYDPKENWRLYCDKCFQQEVV